MSQVTVKWTIRANGRHEGDREQVELTPSIQALIAAGRLVVVQYHPVILDLDEPVAALDADTTRLVPSDADPGDEHVETPEEVMAATLTRSKPRGPRAANRSREL